MADTFKVNIGIELQAPACLMFFETPERTLYHTESLVYYAIQYDPEKCPLIELYGDRMSDKELLHKFEDFLRHYQGSEFRFEESMHGSSSEKKSYSIKLDENAMTDAEFILTYMKFENTRISSILPYIVNKLIDAFRQVKRILKTEKSRRITDLFFQKPPFREKKCVTEPFDRGNNWYHFESDIYNVQGAPFHLLTLDKTVPDSFMTQVTLGIPYSRIIDVLEYFCILFTTRLRPSSPNYKMKYLDMILNMKRSFITILGRETMETHPKVYTMLILVFYMFASKRSIKEYPFFIRHHFSSILKILSNEEFDLLYTWIQLEGWPINISWTDLDILTRAYSKKPLQYYRQLLNSKENNFSKQDLKRQVHIIENMQECACEGSIFPVRTMNHSDDKIILVEVRYIDYLLASYLDPPNEYKYLNEQDLLYIYSKLVGAEKSIKRTRNESPSRSPRRSSRRRVKI